MIDRSSQVRQILDAAIAQLTIVGDPRQEIETFVHLIRVIASGETHEDQTKTNLSALASRFVIENELKSVIRYSDKLSSLLGSLNSGTIQSLHDAPAMSFGQGSEGFANIAQLRRIIPKELEILARVAKKARLSNASVSTKKGRRPKLRTMAVTRITAKAYRDLTQSEPSHSEKPDGFYTLLQASFAAVGIDASVEAATKSLLSRRQKAKI